MQHIGETWHVDFGIIKIVKAMTTENIYMTVKITGSAWSEAPQTYLGYMEWADGVKIAKQQSNEVRLCTSPGYNNQGHYIQPDKYYSNPHQQ